MDFVVDGGNLAEAAHHLAEPEVGLSYFSGHLEHFQSE